MRLVNICFVLFFSFPLCIFSQVDLIWATGIGGTDQDRGYSITHDLSNNIYTTGYFNDIVDFDPSGSTFNLSSAGNTDIFISKLDASGTFVWAEKIGGTSFELASSITTDQFGNIFITGNYNSITDFDPGSGVTNIMSSGSSDVFVVKLDSSGALLWAKSLGGTLTDDGYSITVDASGNVYTAGSFSGTADFDPGPSTYNLTSFGGVDVFISKLDAAGNFIWVKQFGGTGSERAYSISLDISGNVYSTGFFNGTSDFNPGVAVNNLTSFGINDIFISKLDVSGNFVFVKQIGGTGDQIGNSITVSGGNIYTTGYFDGIIDFDPGASTYNLTSSGQDVFISNLSTSGAFVWAKSSGGTGNDYGTSITVDINGNVITTGQFYSIADFDPSVSVYNLTSAGANDAFISKLDPSGALLWAGNIAEGSNGAGGLSVTSDLSGNIYATGFHSLTTDFDPSISTNNITAVGFSDIFILKLGDVTSIKESIYNNKIVLAPNPNTGLFKVIFEFEINSKIVIDIYNLTGQRLLSLNQSTVSSNQNSILIDLSELSNGIYFIKAYNEDIQQTSKFVINK